MLVFKKKWRILFWKEEKLKKNKTIVIPRSQKPNFGKPKFRDWLRFQENKLGLNGTFNKQTQHWREVPFPFPKWTPERLYNEVWFDLFFITCCLWWADINTVYEARMGSAILEWLVLPDIHQIIHDIGATWEKAKQFYWVEEQKEAAAKVRAERELVLQKMREEAIAEMRRRAQS